MYMEIDDFEADCRFDIDFPYGVPCDKWTKKDGNQILVIEMSDKHIKNCMNMVGKDDPWYDYFQKELQRRVIKQIFCSDKQNNLRHCEDCHEDF